MANNSKISKMLPIGTVLCFTNYRTLSKLTRKQPNIAKDPNAIYSEGGRGGPEWKRPSDLTPVQLQPELRKMEKMMRLITRAW